jgi:hypothetical protein
MRVFSLLPVPGFSFFMLPGRAEDLAGQHHTYTG